MNMLLQVVLVDPVYPEAECVVGRVVVSLIKRTCGIGLLLRFSWHA